MPTFHDCLIAPVAGSSARTVFWPFAATYNVEPSEEYTDLAGSADAPFTVGSETVVGTPRVPSLLTGNRARPLVSGNHSTDPSGEYVGPSWPTLPLEIFSLTPE